MIEATCCGCGKQVWFAHGINGCEVLLDIGTGGYVAHECKVLPDAVVVADFGMPMENLTKALAWDWP
jgi:hypothetical protein